MAIADALADLVEEKLRDPMTHPQLLRYAISYLEDCEHKAYRSTPEHVVAALARIASTKIDLPEMARFRELYGPFLSRREAGLLR